MSILFSSLVLSASVPVAIATSNATVPTVGWVSDPNGRGTFSLVFSCLLTLGLCVWSAMHLNIPPHNESPAKTWLRNLKWGVIGTFGPELVVFAAWRQYNSARTLCAEVKRHVEIEKLMQPRRDEVENGSKDKSLKSDSESIESTHPWTMTHSFYAGMGGFVIELNGSSADRGMPFIPGSQPLTLSARGVAFLARCGHLPNIPEDDIVDKSKADGLAKFLVCLQAAWMVVQVIARLVLGLPVTLLEVNILGHVLCAFVIYMLWWHKPRLVHESTKLKGDWVEPLCAYMYMSSQISGSTSTHAGILRRTWIDPELSALALFAPRPQGELDNNKTEKHPADENEDCEPGQTASQVSIGISSQACDVTSTTIPVSEGGLNLNYFGPRPRSSSPAEGFIFSGASELAQNPSTMQLNRWRLAAKAVQMYPTIRERFTAKSNTDARKNGGGWFEPMTEELVTRVTTNWPGEDLLRGTGGHVMGMVLWFASMAYGGVHLAAWNDYFPTTIEAWLWRSSSICITSSGLIWLMINLLAENSKAIDEYWDSVLELRARWSSYLILGSLCSICGAAYCFARIFLVIEALISIRQLPAAAYLTPEWTQIIPHL